MFGIFLAPREPQASNWAPDASMGEVCTSVLFISIETVIECGKGYKLL